MSAKKQPNFEEKMQRLQVIVEQLEAPATTLDESLILYREGHELTRACREHVEQARNELRVLNEEKPI